MNPYLAIVLLLICSAFFSSSEIAFAAANKTRLRKSAESGCKKGCWALKISDCYDKALCSVLIGNNLVNIAASSVATVIAMHLIGDAGVALATGVMTVLLLIFGEILPKQLAKQFCDNYALAVSPILRLFMLITSPLVLICMRLIALLSKLWGGAQQDNNITYDDLVTILETVEEEGVIDEDCCELLQSAIEFDETEVREVITHRTDMLSLDINDPPAELIRTALDSQFSRIPVYDDGIDDIIGILPVNHLLKALLDSDEPDIRSMLTEAVFVPQSKKLPAVLDQMRRNKLHIVIVTDDYGGTLGMVTMEDILEELVGEIWDETDEIELDIVEQSENTLLIDGTLMLGDFLEHLEVEDPELDDHIITVGGWVTELLGDYPTVGQTVSYRDYDITVTQMDEFRVEQLRVEKVIRAPDDEKDDD